MKFLYLGHPVHQYEGDTASLAKQCAQTPAAHGNWSIRASQYEFNASLNIRDFCSLVLQTPGPVLLLQPVQNKTLEGIRQRLTGRVPVEAQTIITLDDLRTAIIAVGQRFDQGEPFLPLDVVVALLMLRKLDQERMWGGNAKGYMWSADIPRGRGLDEKYAARVSLVLNILLQHKLLIQKTSQSKKKYALNPNLREDIYAILRTRKLPPDVERPLMRHGAEETIRSLDLLDDYELAN